MLAYDIFATSNVLENVARRLTTLHEGSRSFSSVGKPPPPVLNLPLETNEYRTGYSDPNLGYDPGQG